MSIKTHTFDKPLHLERGGIIESPTIAYSTFGTLNDQRDNVTLVCHALTANSLVDDWWSGLFGENKVIDPTRDFIICINNLGSPYGSAAPNHKANDGGRYGLNFPDYTLRDTALFHDMLLGHLGIDQVRLIIGGSCGGNIALELAIIKNTAIEHMIIMCCSAYETPWVISIHESQRIVLSSDPTLEHNSDKAGQAGLRGARAFALPFYRSHASFKLRQSEDDNIKMDNFKASSYVRYQGDKFVDRYDAQCYYKQLSALDTHHLGRGRNSVREALGLIKTDTLVLGFSSDLLIPTVEQKFIADHLANATYTEINTLFGHDAFLIETDAIQDAINLWTSNLSAWS